MDACVHRLDLGLYSHPKEFGGNGGVRRGGGGAGIPQLVVHWACCPA